MLLFPKSRRRSCFPKPPGQGSARLPRRAPGSQGGPHRRRSAGCTPKPPGQIRPRTRPLSSARTQTGRGGRLRGLEPPSQSESRDRANGRPRPLKGPSRAGLLRMARGRHSPPAAPAPTGATPPRRREVTPSG